MEREKISQHFYRDEFACLCGCGFDAADIKLVEILEEVRNYFGVPVTIVEKGVPAELTGSACRCAERNALVGGGDTSQHLLGKAADTTVVGVTPGRVYDYLDATYFDTLGLGLYNSFVHIDVRKRKARWGK